MDRPPSKRVTFDLPSLGAASAPAYRPAFSLAGHSSHPKIPGQSQPWQQTTASFGFSPAVAQLCLDTPRGPRRDPKSMPLPPEIQSLVAGFTGYLEHQREYYAVAAAGNRALIGGVAQGSSSVAARLAKADKVARENRARSGSLKTDLGNACVSLQVCFERMHCSPSDPTVLADYFRRRAVGFQEALLRLKEEIDNIGRHVRARYDEADFTPADLHRAMANLQRVLAVESARTQDTHFAVVTLMMRYKAITGRDISDKKKKKAAQKSVAYVSPFTVKWYPQKLTRMP